MVYCNVSQVVQSRLDLEQVRSILSEYRIHNADITLRCDATADDIIDVVEGNRVYIPAIYLLNKIDQISIEVGGHEGRLRKFNSGCLFVGVGYNLQDSACRTNFSPSQMEL